MKLLIITVIVLAIPTFFVLVFVMSTVNMLASLRKRCADIRRRVNPGAAVESVGASDSRHGLVRDADARREFALSAEQYNAARTRFPASLLAALWGFRELDALPDPPVNGGQPGQDRRAP